MPQFTASEYQEWASQPITIEFLSLLLESRAHTLESWAREMYVGANAESTAMANAKALGGVQVLNQLIERLNDYAMGVKA